MNAQPVSLVNTALRYGLFTGVGLALYVEDMMIRAGMDGAQLEQEMGKLVRRMERIKDIGYATWTSLLSAIVSPGVIGLIVGAAVNTRKQHEKYYTEIDMNNESN